MTSRTQSLLQAFGICVSAQAAAAQTKAVETEQSTISAQSASLGPFLLLLSLVISLAFTIWFVRALQHRWLRRERERDALQENAKQLQLVLSTSGCELWEIDLQARRLLRYNEIASVGLKSPREGVALARFLEVIYAEDKASFLAAFDSYVSGKTAQFEAYFRIRSASGQLLWLRSRGRQQSENKVSGTTVDVTDIKLAEQTLQQLNATLEKQLAELERTRAHLIDAEQRRKLALWGSGCEFFQSDLRAGTVLRENQIPHLAANTKAKMLSEYWRFLHPDDRESFNSAFVEHVTGKTEFYDVTYRALHEDGHWVWVQTRGRAVGRDADGRVYLLAGTNYDVTELKRTEFQLSELAASLEQRVKDRTQDLSLALDELKRAQRQLVDTEKMAALGGLVAGIAHEINTPIGISVTAASHLAEQTAMLQRKLTENTLTKSTLSEFVDTAKQSSDLVLNHLRRASELIRSFMQVAVDQSSEQQRTIVLHSYLDDILNSLRPSFRKSKIDIQIECEPSLLWYTYPGAVYQIVANLTLNAISHAFGEQPGSIVIRAQAQGEMIELAVEDNGVGIPEALRERIFEPFFTTKRGQGGSGLGLHIVFNLVTQVLGGRIDVFANTPSGSRFVIVAPMQIAT